MDEGPGRRKKSFIMSVRETKTIFIFMRSLKSHSNQLACASLIRLENEGRDHLSGIHWRIITNPYETNLILRDITCVWGSENMTDVYFLQTFMSKQEVLLLINSVSERAMRTSTPREYEPLKIYRNTGIIALIETQSNLRLIIIINIILLIFTIL